MARERHITWTRTSGSYHPSAGCSRWQYACDATGVLGDIEYEMKRVTEQDWRAYQSIAGGPQVEIGRGTTPDAAYKHVMDSRPAWAVPSRMVTR
jgi:hypothetical protein